MVLIEVWRVHSASYVDQNAFGGRVSQAVAFLLLLLVAAMEKGEKIDVSPQVCEPSSEHLEMSETLHCTCKKVFNTSRSGRSGDGNV